MGIYVHVFSIPAGCVNRLMLDILEGLLNTSYAQSDTLTHRKLLFDYHTCLRNSSAGELRCDWTGAQWREDRLAILLL